MSEGGQDAELESLIARAHQEHSKRLALGAALVIGSSQALATDADVMLRSWLKYLQDERGPIKETDGVPGDMLKPLEVFSALRHAALSAFPDSPTDTEILKNSATPDLVRYLLASLRRYDGKPSNLARAFKASEPRAGSPRGVVRYAPKILRVSRSAYDGAINAGQGRDEALAVAVEAGFKQYRASSGYDPDPKGSKQKKKDRELKAQIKAFLFDEWFG